MVLACQHEGEGWEDEDNRLMLELSRAEGDPPLETCQPYRGSNYDLFAVLDGVKNGTGFAGLDTGDPVDPISPPRGVPRDASHEYRRLVEEWAEDGFEHSFLTVAEMDYHDWDAFKVHRAVLDAPAYERVLAAGDPAEWSQPLFPEPPAVLAQGEYDAWIATGRPASGSETAELISSTPGVHVRVEWAEPLRDAVGERFFASLDAMRALKPHAPEELRMCFFFDG